MMMNRKYIVALITVMVLGACRKEDIAVHSGFTRIDYKVEDPMEWANISFELDNTHDLMRYTHCQITLIAGEEAADLSLTIMLEDENGYRTDQSPFYLTTNQIIKDNQSHTYSFEFGNSLQSTGSPDGEIDIRTFKRVLIYINPGILGKAGEGYFWLDKISFTASEE